MKNLLTLALSLVGIFPSLTQAQSDQVIYADSLQNSWQNWSWATVNLGNTSPVYSGSHSISVSSPAASYQALYLHHSPQDTTGYSSLRFWIYLATADASPVKVQATRLGAAQAEFPLANTTPNAWREVTIPLSSLNVADVSDFDGFWIQSITGAALTFYVDDITLVATPPPAEVQVTVDAGNTLQTIDGRIYGINTAVWDFQTGNATNAALLTDMGMRVLRYPGGSLSNDYNWHTNRGVTNSSFQWVASPPKFLTMAASLGVEACITVNYGSGTPEQAAAWVAYCNASPANTNTLGIDAKGRDWNTVGHWAALRAATPLATDDGFNFLRIGRAAPFGVKYWEVGNECYGSWEKDEHGTSGSGLSGLPHDPFTYAQAFAVFFQKMRLADEGIHIGAVGITGQDSYPSATHSVPNPNEGNALHRGWTPVVLANLKTLGITPQFLVYHSYAQAPGAENDAQLLQASSSVAGSAANLRKLITDYFGSGGENIELQMTEVNSVFTTPGKQSVSLVNGLFMADMIGQVSRSEFKACMWWDLRSASDANQNNSPSLYGWRNFGTYGVLASGDRGDTPLNTPFPTFYAAKLLTHWGRHGDAVLGASSSSPMLAAHAARLADGRLALLVINKSPTTDLAARISLSQFLPGSTDAVIHQYAKANDLAGADLTVIPITNAGESFTVTFPSYSMNVIVLAAPQGFSAWQQGKFTSDELADPAISGPAADPDQDGITNLLEYALALEPKTASRLGLPVMGEESINGETHATFTFTKPRVIDDISYTVQVSTDLEIWNSGPGHAIRTDDGSTDQATFRLTRAVSEGPGQFVRLLVMLSAPPGGSH